MVKIPTGNLESGEKELKPFNATAGWFLKLKVSQIPGGEIEINISPIDIHRNPKWI